MVLQDQTSGAALPVESAGSEAPAEGSSAPQGNGVHVSEDGIASPLRVYYEYLSFLFRRPAALSAQEQGEMAYRDHLQARSRAMPFLLW